VDGGGGREEAGVVVLRRGEGRVSVEEGELLGVRRVEAEVALTHFEADGGDGEWSVVAVFDNCFDCCGILQIGAEGGGDAELLLMDVAASLGEVHAEDGSGEGFAGGGGGALGAVEDADVAAEVGFQGGGEIEGDAFDGDALGQDEGGDALAAVLGDGRAFDGGGVEGLSFAAGGNGGSGDDLRRGLEGAGAGGA